MSPALTDSEDKPTTMLITDSFKTVIGAMQMRIKHTH